MNATIQITPRAFGNIAAAAMAHGCDVTTYLVAAATAKKQTAAAASAAAPAPAPVAHKPAPVAHKPAASAGLFDNL